jgi:nicotinic acid mononucleotide adenylyltransferase
MSGSDPHIELIERAAPANPSVGVFASSFNPVTIAHTELIRRAAEDFSLGEMLALAGRANADKTGYECELDDRLKMLLRAFEPDERVSIGVSSHAFYVDMLDALAPLYPGRDLHFVVGFDTFERVLDRENRYAGRYHHHFADREQVLRYLFSRCRFIVAARKGAGREEIEALMIAEQAEFRDAISFLDFPPGLGERSATEVRDRRRAGGSISGLVSPAVEAFILEHGLYR